MTRLDTIIELRRLAVCEAALKWLAHGPNREDDYARQLASELAAATNLLRVAQGNRDRIVKKGGA